MYDAPDVIFCTHNRVRITLDSQFFDIVTIDLANTSIPKGCVIASPCEGDLTVMTVLMTKSPVLHVTKDLERVVHINLDLNGTVRGRVVLIETT